jgi:hypothetical protein
VADLPTPRSARAQDGRTESARAHHESTDVDLRGVLMFAAGLVVVAIAIHLLVWVMFRFFEAREARQAVIEYPLAATEGNRLPPEPRLQTNPRQDLLDLRAEEDRILHSYGWVDRNAGIVRIPIEEAMRVTVQRGLPAREERK